MLFEHGTCTCSYAPILDAQVIEGIFNNMMLLQGGRHKWACVPGTGHDVPDAGAIHTTLPATLPLAEGRGRQWSFTACHRHHYWGTSQPPRSSYKAES